eukprot:8653103-Alexandrium_andersonii.AAC.1
MSASLVGSEMCIRDSREKGFLNFGALPGSARGGRPGRSFGSRAREFQESPRRLRRITDLLWESPGAADGTSE